MRLRLSPAALSLPLALAVLAGCGGHFSRISYSYGDGIVSFKQSDDRIEIRIDRDGEKRHAILVADDDEPRVNRRRVYQVKTLSPPTDDLSGIDLTWVFRWLEPGVDLRDPDGVLQEHPDRDLTGRLLEQLATGTPNLEKVLRSMTGLLRTESRTEVFLSATRQPDLTPDDVDLLVEAAVQGYGGPLFGPTPDGDGPGGARNGMLVDCLLGISRRNGISGPQLDRIARTAPQVSSSSQQKRLLLALAGRASTDAVLDGARSIGPSTSRREVLQRLAGQEALPTREYDQVAAATLQIPSSSAQAQVLSDLCGKASTEAIVDATRSIGSPRSKAEVLERLVGQPGLEPDELNVIASATPQIGSSSYQAGILVRLAGRASTSTILDATRSIGSAKSKYQVLESLAQQMLSESDYDRIAAATVGIGSSSYQQKALVDLVGKASPKAILPAVHSVGSSRSKFEVLYTLAQRGDNDTRTANLIASATTSVGSSSYQAKILVALVNQASPGSILTASGHIGSPTSKTEVFEALARATELSTDEANRIAAATRSIGSSSYQAKALIALVGRASPQAIRDAARGIGSKHERERVIEALAF